VVACAFDALHATRLMLSTLDQVYWPSRTRHRPPPAPPRLPGALPSLVGLSRPTLCDSLVVRLAEPWAVPSALGIQAPRFPCGAIGADPSSSRTVQVRPDCGSDRAPASAVKPTRRRPWACVLCGARTRRTGS
jgi:hypothetical protein